MRKFCDFVEDVMWGCTGGIVYRFPGGQQTMPDGQAQLCLREATLQDLDDELQLQRDELEPLFPEFERRRQELRIELPPPCVRLRREKKIPLKASSWHEFGLGWCDLLLGSVLDTNPQPPPEPRRGLRADPAAWLRELFLFPMIHEDGIRIQQRVQLEHPPAEPSKPAQQAMPERPKRKRGRPPKWSEADKETIVRMHDGQGLSFDKIADHFREKDVTPWAVKAQYDALRRDRK